MIATYRTGHAIPLRMTGPGFCRPRMTSAGSTLVRFVMQPRRVILKIGVENVIYRY